jgi:hypothetical protein
VVVARRLYELVLKALCRRLYELLSEDFAQHNARVLLCSLSVVSLFRSEPCLCSDLVHVVLQAADVVTHLTTAAMPQGAWLRDRSI